MTRQLPRYSRQQRWVDGRRIVSYEPYDEPACWSVTRIVPPVLERSYRVGRRFDGMVTSGTGIGLLHGGQSVRVFAPAWWQVWRWWSYWRATVRGWVAVMANGRFYAVRALAVTRPARPRGRRA